MNGKKLFDTNIVIRLFEDDPEITANISPDEKLFVPCIVMGELRYGAEKSFRTEENLNRIEKFAGVCQKTEKGS